MWPREQSCGLWARSRAKRGEHPENARSRNEHVYIDIFIYMCSLLALFKSFILVQWRRSCAHKPTHISHATTELRTGWPHSSCQIRPSTRFRALGAVRTRGARQRLHSGTSALAPKAQCSFIIKHSCWDLLECMSIGELD